MLSFTLHAYVTVGPLELHFCVQCITDLFLKELPMLEQPAITNIESDSKFIHIICFVVVFQSLSHIQLFATPWTTEGQAPLSFTISKNLLKLMLIDSVVPSNISSSIAPYSSCPQPFPALKYFPMSWLLPSGGQISGASVLATVLPMNTQGWFPLGLTGLTLQSKRCSRSFSSPTIWKH